jgi:hypothetical protein
MTINVDAMRRSQAKLCMRCQRWRGLREWALWRCRLCDRWFCEHLSRLKGTDGTALCGACKRGGR